MPTVTFNDLNEPLPLPECLQKGFAINKFLLVLHNHESLHCCDVVKIKLV